jgi:hypothetical protein
MTGKCYYITTLGDWQRHSPRFATSHFVLLPPSAEATSGTAGEPASDAAARILVLVEADEGVHLALEDDPAFEALPHPLSQKPVSPAAQDALAVHGVAPGATTFDAAEAVARVHPLLRHRVF